jgi:drug/metabolite transporter (DMT)-like permease
MLLAVLAQRKAISKIDLLHGGMVGVALYLAFLFQTKGLKFTSASNAAFITGLAVIFTPALLFVWLKVKPERGQIMGAFLATIGLALLTLKGLSIQTGDLLVLICAASFALHIILLSRASKIANLLNIAFIQILVVGLLSLAQSMIFQELSAPKSAATINAILMIGILGTAIGFYVQTKAQVASSPNRIALIIVLEPAFGGFFGYVLAGDRLSVVNWIGAALIVAGMLVAETHFSRREPEAF